MPWYTPGDVTKSAGIGLVQGAIGLASLPGTAQWLLRKGVDAVAGTDYANTEPTTLPTYDTIKNKVEEYTGEFYKPKSVVGEYARTAGESAPGLIGGPAGFGARALATGVGAVASETAGQVTKGTEAEPYARVGAGFIGSFAPSIGARAATPFPATPERNRLMQTLDAENIPVLAGDRTGRRQLKWAEAVTEDIPFAGGGYAGHREAQGRALTAAALRRAGENADNVSQPVIDHAFTRIGQSFDDVASRNVVQPDQQLVQDLTDVAQEYTRMVPTSSRTPIEQDTLTDLANAFNTHGGLAGESYQALRSRLDKAARSSRFSDPQLSEALFGIRNSLDDAMERSVSPADANQWREARRQYRNLLVIEDAATKGGSQNAEALISPSALYQAATKTKGDKRNMARGHGDLAELANAAKKVIKDMPQSGTTPRAQYSNLMALPMALAGGSIGGAAGALAATAGPAIASRVLMSNWAQNRLGNQAVRYRGQPGRNTASQALAAPAIADTEEDQNRLLQLLQRQAP
jgi:hypothetical protein